MITKSKIDCGCSERPEEGFGVHGFGEKMPIRDLFVWLSESFWKEILILQVKLWVFGELSFWKLRIVGYVESFDLKRKLKLWVLGYVKSFEFKVKLKASKLNHRKITMVS